MTKDLEQDRVHANDRCTKLETKVHTETAKMEQNMSGAIVQTDSQLESLNDTVGRHHEHFSNLCSNLDAKYQEENDAISHRIQDAEDHFMVPITEVYTRMSKELKEKNEAQDERMEGDYQYVVGLCTDMYIRREVQWRRRRDQRQAGRRVRLPRGGLLGGDRQARQDDQQPLRALQ